MDAQSIRELAAACAAASPSSGPVEHLAKLGPDATHRDAVEFAIAFYDALDRRPRKPRRKAQHTTTFLLRLSPELRDAIHDRAHSEGTTASAWLRGLIERALDQ